MKITIAYTSASEKEAAAAVAAIRSVLPGADPKYREKHPPFKHIYITIPEPKENT